MSDEKVIAKTNFIICNLAWAINPAGSGLNLASRAPGNRILASMPFFDSKMDLSYYSLSGLVRSSVLTVLRVELDILYLS